jgi:PKD repeat protein
MWSIRGVVPAIVCGAGLLVPSGAAAALSVQTVGQGTPALTAQDMATVLAGPGITVQPGATYSGAALASGTFTAGSDPYPVAGVGLTSGHLAMLSPALPNYSRSVNNGTAGDATASDPLGTGTPVATFDAAALTFSVVPVSSELTIDYVFGSNEYEDPGARFDDRVAITIGSGSSCAVVPGTSTIVSVFGIDETHNSTLFRANTGSPRPFAPVDVSGLTTRLRCSATVTPGVAVSVKFVVADTSDHLNDSALLLAAGSLRSNLPPVPALAAEPTSGKAPRSVSFSTTGSTDPDGPATISSWSLAFGDGSAASATGPPPTTLSHTYVAAGSFTATLTLTDDHGDTRSATRSITVLNPNVAPRAAITSSPLHPQTGMAITLRSAASDPDGRIAATTWDLNNDGRFGDAVGPSAVVRYTSPGVYVVRQRVTDDDGASAEASVTLTVTAPVVSLSTKSSTLPVTPAGIATATLKCVGNATCTGHATLTVKTTAKRPSRRTITIATAHYSIAGGKTGKVAYKLTAAGRKLLRTAHGNLKVTLTLIPNGHGVRSVSRSMTLRAKKR